MKSRSASPTELMLAEGELPGIYQMTNRSSVEAQRRFLRWSGLGLLMVILAAATDIFTGKYRLPGSTADLMGMAAAVAFGIALLVRIRLLSDRPQKTWYEGRAAAESAKTLAWRYAVGGGPFRADRNPDEVDATLREQLGDILTDLHELSLAPPSGETQQITQKMRELRARPLEERKEAYSIGRIRDQIQWYSRKAEWNRRRAYLWQTGLMFLEIAGLVGALLVAVAPDPPAVLGLAGTLIAAGGSWLQAKQHATLAAAYAVAALELSAIDERIASHKSEESWAQFVSEAEDAVSREHRLWRASRTK